MFKGALEKGELPLSMRESIITLIHKEGKDPVEPDSY